MSIPSVRGLAPAVLLIFFFSLHFSANAQILGKWECADKSGQTTENLAFSIRCGGTLLFKSDRILESSCTDGFFPSGTYWEVHDNQLTLRDSAGKAFADYTIQENSAQKLVLLRNKTAFSFRRVAGYGENGNGKQP